MPTQFRRLATRRGRTRAIVAVAHSILVIACHLLARRTTDHDLGTDHLDTRDPERAKRRAVQRLQALGDDVDLKSRQEVT